MAQIFISHSQKDKEIISLFTKAFSVTSVISKFEELEKLCGQKIDQENIRNDIKRSGAVFILLSENVNNIPHTRDWITWESGVASNKDVWVFELKDDFNKIKVLIPKINHFVVFNITDGWIPYIRKIIESYDKPPLRSTVLKGTAMGLGVSALVNQSVRKKADRKENNLAGAFIGGVGALLVSLTGKERPNGTEIMCKSCGSSYRLHIVINDGARFRCPVCNHIYRICPRKRI